MDERVEPADRAEPTGNPPELPGDPPELPELPDLTQLSLAELGTVQHPLLKEVLTDLRERAKRPSEMLWGWNSSF